MKMNLAKLGLLGALVLCGTFAARAEETIGVPTPASVPNVPVAQEPQNWLAFLSYQGGFKPIEFYVLDQTPYIILFQDGRLIWRDDNIKYDAPNRRRDMWREAKISPQALKDFRAKSEALNFLTMEKPEEIAPKPGKEGVIEMRPQIADASTTVLGLRLQRKVRANPTIFDQRIISEYALGAFGDEDKDNRYIQALMTMQKMLLDLRPKESQRFEPDSIRVTFMNGNSRGVVLPEASVAVQEWPFADKPNLEGANVYNGAQAKTLVEMLSKNPLVQVGDKIVSANWTPAIGIPQNQLEKTIATTLEQ